MDTIVNKFCKVFFPHHVDLEQVFQHLDFELNKKHQNNKEQHNTNTKSPISSAWSDNNNHD